ncbi:MULTISPECIES: glycosyltransferase [unclassified Bacillus (in: firmicutes)]|uniref:CgeB family protein n=1 Tax=unclassified Bacillus (in: firmicutes) TaxID=185979 RepID=UPI00159705AD|nr:MULTISPECIES: glycosyltransferase [unclassified Bacillus (in: firmicutes)]
MKILFIEAAKQYLLGLPSGFEKAGCEVKILTDITETELEKTIKEFKPNLAVTAGWTKIHTKTNLQILRKLLKKYDIKHAYWATEDPRWREEWSHYYINNTRPDFVFTIDRDSIPFYQKLGYSAHYLPWACNPDFHKPGKREDQYACDIAVVATAGVKWNSYRKDSVQILLKPLIEKGFDVSIWGKRWDRLDPDIVGFNVPSKFLREKLPYLDTNHVYSSAKIVLGFQNTTTELTSRSYEVLAARGFLLAPCTPAIQETFIPGKHLVCSQSPKETVELVDYYLKHEEERKKIALSGQKEVYTNHTYKHRAEEILKIVGKLSK